MPQFIGKNGIQRGGAIRRNIIGIPQGQTEAVKPVIPIKPVEPIKPVIPIKPVEPIRPIEPPKPRDYSRVKRIAKNVGSAVVTTAAIAGTAVVATAALAGLAIGGHSLYSRYEMRNLYRNAIQIDPMPFGEDVAGNINLGGDENIIDLLAEDEQPRLGPVNLGPPYVVPVRDFPNPVSIPVLEETNIIRLFSMSNAKLANELPRLTFDQLGAILLKLKDESYVDNLISSGITKEKIDELRSNIEKEQIMQDSDESDEGDVNVLGEEQITSLFSMDPLQVITELANLSFNQLDDITLKLTTEPYLANLKRSGISDKKITDMTLEVQRAQAMKETGASDVEEKSGDESEILKIVGFDMPELDVLQPVRPPPTATYSASSSGSALLSSVAPSSVSSAGLLSGFFSSG